MNRDPLWLVLLAYALGAAAVGLFGFVLIKGVALCLLDLARRLP